MTRLLAVLAAVLLAAAPAEAGLTVGVNDNAAIDPTEIGWFYPTMGAEGFQLSTITLRWDETAPATIPNEAMVTQAIAAAQATGQTIELDLYPLHSAALTGGQKCTPSSDPQACGSTPEIQAFASWVGQVAAAFPTVRQYVVMNECNQPLFVNPQFDSAGNNESAEVCGRALAASYDALKAANPQNFVWGVGLSPRGNDNPNAGSNVSTSPVAFLKDLGTWFKAYAAATSRTRPLMDGLDFHPYPIPQSLPFATGYADPTSATVSNLSRIYQAFYDGFSGSPQKTIGQQAGGGLPVSLNEVGIQTDSTGQSGYVGVETAANAAGGVLGATATEDYQSSWYLQMLQLVACDPNVKVVDIYHLIDEPALSGWQSGLYYVDRSAKESAATVHDWIASTGGACQGQMHPWAPAGVSAAPSAPATPTSTSGPRIVIGAAGRVLIYDAVTHALRRTLAPFGTAYTGPLSLALGDVNKDGVPDIAVAEAATVKILNGKSGGTIASYTPFPKATGTSVALADVNGDGRADLIAGAAGKVKVFDGKTHRLIETLTPFGTSYHGAVSVAAGDVNGDHTADVVAATGPGSTGQVAVFSGATATRLELLTPFSLGFKGGLTVAVGDVNGDGKADVIAATGPGTPAVIRVYSGASKTRLASFSPYPSFTAGVSVSAADVNTDGKSEIVAAPGPGGGSQVKVFAGTTGILLSSFLGATGSNQAAVAAG